MDNATNILLIIFLLAANGFFVAAEFALVKARGFRIESASNEGNAAAQLTLRIQANLESYLAACQLGITMASLGLGWVGEPAVAAILEPLFRDLGMSEAMLHTSAFIVGFLIFSSLHIVIGEQVPKTLAIRKAEPVSIWTAYPLHLCYMMVWPLNWLLSRATSLILSFFNVDEVSHVEVFTGDEIKGMVATSKEHGEIHERQATMLHNLFEFDHRRVGRIMIPTHSVHLLDITGDPKVNMEIIRVTNHSRFPMVNGDKDDLLIGVVLAKDIHRAMLNGEDEPWKNLEKFRRSAMIVPESQHIAKLFDLMRVKRAHMACVVDEYGSFVGIVTLEDLLEEIVGEIEDETDEEKPNYGILRLDDTSWDVDGMASLTDVQRIVGLEVGDEVDANTIGGLLLRRLSRMPEKGDVIDEAGYQLQVLEHDGRRVINVRVTRMDAIYEATAEEA
ncbi:MAG: hemolysin family protein [Gammaproteobacteria bacterium]|nr:hemolysin family protein [Gammaproteobacteria bacterium]